MNHPFEKKLDQLQRRSRQYFYDAKAGVKNPKLAAIQFNLTDDLRSLAGDGPLLFAAKQIADATEEFIRVAHSAPRSKMEAAQRFQAAAIAEAYAHFTAGDDGAVT